MEKSARKPTWAFPHQRLGIRFIYSYSKEYPKSSRGRTGFDRMTRGSDCVSWLVGGPR